MATCRRILILTWGILFFAGCSAPEPAPLTASAVEGSLAAPAMSVLRMKAQQIRHPLLKGLVLDDRDGISPDEAAVLAVLVNPSLRAIRDQRGVAQAQLLQAKLLPNPTAELTNDFPYAGPDPFVAYGVLLKWDISQLITQGAKEDAVRSQAATVDLDVAWQEWQVAQTARSAVYKQLLLEQQLSLARDVDRGLKENLQTVQKAVRQQLKTETDLSAADAASVEAHTTVLQLEREFAKGRLALNRLLGLPPHQDVRLQSVPLPSQMTPPTLEALEQGLDQGRLDLLALRRGYDAQEANIRAAVLGRFGQFSLGPSHGRDTSSNYTFGYNASVDLPIFDQGQGKIAIEQATRQRLFDEFVNRVHEARSDIATALADIDSLNRQIRFATDALPALQRLVQSYERALAAGNADVLSYYTARNNLAKKRIDLLKLKQELIDTWISLENASGQYLLQPNQPTSAPALISGPISRSSKE